MGCVQQLGVAMSLSNIREFSSNVIAYCENHDKGDGRSCSYGVDSEYYSQNTIDQHVVRRPGSHPAN